MTEQEARTKWCPMVRLTSCDGKAIVNRYTGQTVDKCECVASKRMMWRWHLRGAMVDDKYDENYPLEGHCGLGGKP